MIDRTARDQLSELLRHLVAGAVSRDELELRKPRSRDLAVREVIDQAWLLYGDLREDKRSGARRVKREDRREVSRWILFLNTDQEYRWPTLPTWARILGFFPSILTLGLFWRPYRMWFERQGDHRFWPFIDEGEVEAAKRRSRV